MTRTRQQARVMQSSVDALRPWQPIPPVPMPDLSWWFSDEARMAREHLASLSPERRAELDAEWRK